MHARLLTFASDGLFAIDFKCTIYMVVMGEMIDERKMIASMMAGSKTKKRQRGAPGLTTWRSWCLAPGRVCHCFDL